MHSSPLDYFSDNEDVDDDDVEEYQLSRKKRTKNFMIEDTCLGWSWSHVRPGVTKSEALVATHVRHVSQAHFLGRYVGRSIISISPTSVGCDHIML
jgi:hypothetical protein